MKFHVRWLQPPKKVSRWRVQWHHNTESSSWWSDSVIEADTAEEAAAKLLDMIDYAQHTSYRRKGMTVKVYGPIPDEGQEFVVAPSSSVEVVSA